MGRPADWLAIFGGFGTHPAHGKLKVAPEDCQGIDKYSVWDIRDEMGRCDEIKANVEADDLHHALHVGKPTLPERLASAVWSPVDDLEEADLGELIWNGENVSLIAHRIGEKA